MKKCIVLLITVLFLGCAAQNNEYLSAIDVLNTELSNIKGTAEQNAYQISLLREENERMRSELKELQSADMAKEADVKQDAGRAEEVQVPRIVVIEDPQIIRDSLYKYALELYNQKKHDQSIAKFQEFIQKLPQDELAGNSQYWIGENYYSLKEYSMAIDAFQMVINSYPNSPKVADAMFKIGYSYKLMNNAQMAKYFFDKVIAEYPVSNAASLARKAM